MFLTVLGIIISLAGVACRFYGKYTSHNVFLLLNSLFKHGIIDPGALWKSIGNFLIVIGVVLIVVGIGIKRNGFGFSRQSDDEDFDYLDDCPDSDDYYD